ncbi:prepilin-type N-terminal cleavage/methylation domain-containing protein [Terrimicrobium sacchariphilum]|uniref:Prepilin-type N-terminal cleavage/methylation domain-containing protein n=1 Tax=Terrimicrobium sacchariphilum TaxID=690879 RepID=A0A146G238_TERSA|nr:type II secretion system protein [Terrimicrobium sacchariphilum]GAT31895.1 prepilin-type N-terminal cleavage/methylation domain-containing protein [Terrimicrobium sacchariphilum]
MTRLPSRHPAFTLIELLVTIGIIVLLSALAMPALQKAFSSSSKTKCLNRLRQIQTGCITYAAENNGLFPAVNNGYWGPNYFPESTYAQTLKPYLGERNTIMFCQGELNKVRNPQLTSPDYAKSYITYQYFNYAGDFSGTLTGSNKPNLARTSTAPNSLPLWGCMATSGAGRSYGHADPGVSRPLSGMCVVNVDGSARWVKGSDLEAYAYSASTFYWPIPNR